MFYKCMVTGAKTHLQADKVDKETISVKIYMNFNTLLLLMKQQSVTN